MHYLRNKRCICHFGRINHLVQCGQWIIWHPKITQIHSPHFTSPQSLALIAPRFCQRVPVLSSTRTSSCTPSLMSAVTHSVSTVAIDCFVCFKWSSRATPKTGCCTHSSANRIQTKTTIGQSETGNRQQPIENVNSNARLLNNYSKTVTSYSVTHTLLYGLLKFVLIRFYCICKIMHFRQKL